MAVLIGVSAVLFFANLGATSLWDPDEPRQAIMAREMMERQDYLHPYLNGKPYLEKPPFHPWMIILASKLRGSLDETSARLPSAISAALLLFVVFFLGLALKDHTTGLVSALILATNFQFFLNARESVMDMTFAALIGVTIWCAWQSADRKRPFLFILSFVPAGFAILTKGPAGLILPAATLAILLLITKAEKKYFLFLVLGCILSSAIAAPWFVAAGKEYTVEFLIRQNVTRYANAFDHREPVWFYIQKIFVNFLPWSIILPFALYSAGKKKVYLPLVWFSFALVFFTFSQSKRGIYLLPAYPACALLAGLYITEKARSLASERTAGRLAVIFGALLITAPLAAIALFPSVKAFAAVRDQGPLFISILGLLACAAFLFCFFIVRHRGLTALFVLFAYLVVTCVTYHTLYQPLVDRKERSARNLFGPFRGERAPSHVSIYGFVSPAVIFYAGKPITLLWRPEDANLTKPNSLIIVEEKFGVPPVFRQSMVCSGRVLYNNYYFLLFTPKQAEQKTLSPAGEPLTKGESIPFRQNKVYLPKYSGSHYG